MADKATKAAAHYRDGSASKHCSQCAMFRSPHSCTAVSGEISPDGVCDYFERDRTRRYAKKG